MSILFCSSEVKAGAECAVTGPDQVPDAPMNGRRSRTRFDRGCEMKKKNPVTSTTVINSARDFIFTLSPLIAFWQPGCAPIDGSAVRSRQMPPAPPDALHRHILRARA